MKATKLTEAEMTPLRIASLPTRPTAHSSFGGKGYSSAEMKEAFDLLPNLIAERLNLFIDDVLDGSLAEALVVNAEGETLAEVLRRLDGK
jgi:hypothetical protein